MHEPVLAKEMLTALELSGGETVLDCTVGPGGHASLIAPLCRLYVGIDRDPEMVRVARGRVGEGNARFLWGDFSEVPDLLERSGVKAVDRVLFDFGLSSWDIEQSGRGFSYRADEPLDMRFDPQTGETAAGLLARLDERALADVIYRYGEERRSRSVARSIKTGGPVTTTKELYGRISAVVRARPDRSAARVFQALRIAVNDELVRIARGLSGWAQELKTGGRLVAVSYHSLEDRLVKTLGRLVSLRPLFKKPVRASQEEVENNPRARSARLRGFVKLTEINGQDAFSHIAAALPAGALTPL